MVTDSERAARARGTVFPFRLWWGLAACAAIMGLIFALAPYSDPSMFAPDRGNFWYFWQLRDPDFMSRLSAWLPYSVHQVSMWFLIAYARKVRPRYIFGLHACNVWALALNGGFVLLHIVQTKYFYDGLAQDVHEMTSMMSVVLMLLLILLMENGRRGLFFGRRVTALTEIGDVVRRYHGYYFSWAIIYTFWYHPVEMTPGHLAGFAYMFLLMLQGSLFFTRYHTNRWWTMSLETLFIVHGAVVAWYLMQPGQNGPWSMFLFGGMAVFLITQLHGLGLTWKVRLAIAAPLMAAMAAFYTWYPEHLLDVPRVPAIMYAGTFLMAAVVWLLIRCASWLRPPTASTHRV